MEAMPQRRHDPGHTFAQMILALADGATCLSDLAPLPAQRSMFGPVELRGIAAAELKRGLRRERVRPATT